MGKKNRVWNYNIHSSKIQNTHYEINGHRESWTNRNSKHTQWPFLIDGVKTLALFVYTGWIALASSPKCLNHAHCSIYPITVAISHSRNPPFLLCFQGRRVSKVGGLIRSCKLTMTLSSANISAIVCIYICSCLLKKLVKTS